MVVMRIQPIRSWKYCRKSPFEATIVELCSGQTRLFPSEFSGQLYNVFFFSFFSGLLDWIVFILLWFERPLPPDRWLNSSSSWPFKTDDITSSRWDVGGCGGSAAKGITANKKCAIFLDFACSPLWIKMSYDQKQHSRGPRVNLQVR